MTALLIDASEAESRLLTRTALAAVGHYDEKWLQDLLFRHPDLVPLARLDPGLGAFVPLCREFGLPRAGGSVFLDILGVSGTGRLVLIECKLWRNPQARREVIAQVLEYASLLRGWSYGDLSARLAASQGWRGQNPLFDCARQRLPDLDEAAFVEGVSASLLTGDFHLLVAGDGIRSDLQTIATHLNAPGTTRARLSLLEVQVWIDAIGRTVVLPQIAMRTEVIEQRVLLVDQGGSARIEAIAEPGSSGEAPEALPDPDRDAQRARNRAFWEAFIAQARFDNPDQSPPRHGGNNWVRLEMPPPASSMTAYRSSQDVGVFVTFAGDAGEAFFRSCEGQAAALCEESDLALLFSSEGTDRFKGRIGVVQAVETRDKGLDTEQRHWLQSAANRLINLLRPRLAQWQTQPSI